MAIAPAAISAEPAVMMTRVDSTPSDRPAARAKGTVSPSDIPITMSRIVSEAVKCFSTCGVWGTGDLRLGAGERADGARTGSWICYGESLDLDHAVGAELVDLGPGDAEEAGQDLVGVLAEEGRGRLRGPRRVPEPDGHAHGGDGAGLRMVQRDEHAARAEMLALADLGHGLDPARGHAGFVEALQPIRGRARREDRVQERDEHLAVGHAVGFGIEARILREVFPADGAAHPLEERVVRHAQRDVCVLGLEDLVGHDGRVLVSAAAGRPPPFQYKPA